MIINTCINKVKVIRIRHKLSIINHSNKKKRQDLTTYKLDMHKENDDMPQNMQEKHI